MMKAAVFLFAFFLSACSLASSGGALHDRYMDYESSANKDNISDVYDVYFSESIIGENDVKNEDIKGQLLFKSMMDEQHSHYEKVEGDIGCLTINGHDERSGPLIFNMRYVHSNGYWLIDKINITFLDDESGFLRVAKCPS